MDQKTQLPRLTGRVIVTQRGRQPSTAVQMKQAQLLATGFCLSTLHYQDKPSRSSPGSYCVSCVKATQLSEIGQIAWCQAIVHRPQVIWTKRNDLHVLGCASCLTAVRLAKELLRLQLSFLSRKETMGDNAMVRKSEGGGRRGSSR